MKKTLVYDCEIINSPNLHGWHNYSALGICAIGCWASWLPKPQQLQCFTVNGGFEGFQELVDRAEEIVSFNGWGFDDPLCQAHGIKIASSYDLMVEVRRAAGEPLSGRCTPGYNLARLSEVNLGRQKTGHGSKVPDLWQAGEKQAVIDYCLNDVELLRDLYFRRTRLIDPVRYGNVVLHCDPSLTNWREIRTHLNHLLIERGATIAINKYAFRHWLPTNVVMFEFTLFGALFVKFPIWLRPIKSFDKYVGLPFKKPQPKAIAPLRKSNPDEEFDPIPF